MKEPTFRISRKAFLDLEDIWTYTAKRWPIAQADRYHRLLLDEVEYLGSNPNAGKSADHIKPNYRLSVVKSHLVFYRFDKILPIEIIRVLHQKMNVENRL
ncbi:MAG: type II toxin-antitoxin system RelE/ParE family toxin [Flavobacteriales bacterium]|nr:type II toxin-antitoxin system RelE/ParE family toxin [Flavobacteriales bacterium]